MKKMTMPALAEGPAVSAPMVRGMLRRGLCVALLLFAIICSWQTAWNVSLNLLDSDASSNLVLGEKLAREGGILSDSFVYATELYVADSQIIYSLLFRVCPDWSLVRFLGTVIMQSLMLGAYGFLARQSRMSFNAFCVTGAVLLLPFSVPYGRIVLYHNYYIPHITLDLLMVGLYLGAARRADAFRTQRKAGAWLSPSAPSGRSLSPRARALWGVWIHSVLLGLVAFVAGLAGVRQLMICAAPLLLSALLTTLAGERKCSHTPGQSALGEAWPALALALGMVICCTAGYWVNSNVLAKTYTFASYDHQVLSLTGVSGLESIFRGLLVAVGYQDSQMLFTLHGLLSVGSVAALIIALILAAHTMRYTRDQAGRFLSVYPFMTLGVITCVFAFLSGGEFLYELYYLPPLVWILPALGKADLRPVGCPELPGGEAPAKAPEVPAKQAPVSSGKSPKASAAGGKAAAKKSPEASVVSFPAPSGRLTRWGRALGAGERPLSFHGLMALMACALLLANGLYYNGFFRDPASLSSEVDYSGLNVRDPFTVEGLKPAADYLKENGYTMCYTTYWNAAVITELTDGQVRSCAIEQGSRRKAVKYYAWLTDMKLWDPERLRGGKSCILAPFEITEALMNDEKLSGLLTEKESFVGLSVLELSDPAALAEYLQ